MAGSGVLPEGFSELEPFAAEWALASEGERNAKRLASSQDAIQAFYDVMLRHLDALGAHLGRQRVDELNEAERRLFHLALSLMEVAPAVEIHGAPDVPDAIEADRFRICSP